MTLSQSCNSGVVAAIDDNGDQADDDSLRARLADPTNEVLFVVAKILTRYFLELLQVPFGNIEQTCEAQDEFTDMYPLLGGRLVESGGNT